MPKSTIIPKSKDVKSVRLYRYIFIDKKILIKINKIMLDRRTDLWYNGLGAPVLLLFVTI
jgi:hypothetical protein